jgi:hypothetical protein
METEYIGWALLALGLITIVVPVAFGDNPRDKDFER